MIDCHVRERDNLAVLEILNRHEPEYGFAIAFIGLWRAGVCNLEMMEQFEVEYQASLARGEVGNEACVRVLERIAAMARTNWRKAQPRRSDSEGR